MYHEGTKTRRGEYRERVLSDRSRAHTLSRVSSCLRAFVLQSAVSCTILVLAGAAIAAQAQERLNVVLLLSDDHQYLALGCAGHSIIRTPNLDRLAMEGVRFSQAYVSLPICTPSRATLLTGRFEQSHGVTFFGRRIGDDVVPLPRAMAKAGYQTACTGKWHNVRGPDHYGFEWMANMFIGGMGPHRNPKLTQRLGDKPQVVEGFTTELYTDAAVRFLKERDRSRPFFLYVAYTAPHDPREPLERYERMYPAKDMPLPKNFMPAPPFDPGTLEIRDEKLLPLPRDPEQIRTETSRYDGLITHLDEQIARILKELEDQKLADRTIVVFAGDNGLTLGAHGLLGKQTLYEEGVRVPLIMRHPRIGQRGRTSDALVYLADVLPTVFEWTGLALPEKVEARSLARICSGEADSVRDAVFGRYDEKDDPRFRSIRTERYKLIRYLKLDREELFDLREDPYELKDLSGDASMESVKQTLRGQLHEWVKVQGDTVALNHW